MSFWWGVLLSSETPPRNCLDKSSVVSDTLTTSCYTDDCRNVTHFFLHVFFSRRDVQLNENSSDAVVKNL